jgi:hypothetical protein
MSTVFNEGNHDGGFLIREANGDRSRDVGILESGQKLDTGAVLGKITASDKFVEYNPAGGDGSENVSAILFANVDASSNDVDVTLIVRDAEYNSREIVFNVALTALEITTAEDALKALGLIGRGK